jgi:hypothetical protein
MGQEMFHLAKSGVSKGGKRVVTVGIKVVLPAPSVKVRTRKGGALIL